MVKRFCAVALGVLGALFVLGADEARALDFGTVPSVETVASTKTCYGAAISTGTRGYDVIGSTDVGWRAVEIQNLGTGASNLWCKDNQGICATLGSTCNGFRIEIDSGKIFHIPANTRWYCISGASAPSNAVICCWR